MNRVKKLLLGLLGEKKYLTGLAVVFQAVYRSGLPGKDYQDIYFLKEFIGEGDYCVDIGAHLGYYTGELSRLVKNAGRVIAIEPMSKFNRVLRDLLERKGMHNVELLQVAMGGDEPYAEMGIPRVGNAKKFAHARIMKSSMHLEYVESEKIKNEQGDSLLEGLPRLDFIKCDVEGMEFAVFSSLMHTLQKHSPVLLCELGDLQERKKLYELVAPLGYQMYQLKNKKLYPLDLFSPDKPISHNHYFIPAGKKAGMQHLIEHL